MKALIFILSIILLISAVFLVVELSNVFIEPVEFEISSSGFLDENGYGESAEGLEIQYYPNMRFSLNEISYFIDDSCDEKKSSSIGEAFDYLENRIGNINFFESSSNPNIIAKCNESVIRDYETIGRKKHFIVGEGGPTSVISTGLFSVIEEGVIFLFYEKSLCDFPIVEIHELLHVFGFQHTTDKKSIMYPVASCEQDLSVEIINEMKRLYSIESLPDMRFTNITATKQGNYLNFEVRINNQGLKVSNQNNLIIYTYPSNKQIETFDLGTLDYGAGKSLTVTNLKLPLRTNSIKFEIQAGKELDYDNNVVEMSLQD
jgi:hypothetical protein